MRLVVALALTGCSFQPGMLGGAAGDASGDAGADDARADTTLDDAPAEDVMVDAMLDAPPAVAQTTNHTSVADTFLSSASTTTNFNDQTSALVDGAPDQRVVVMRFDLTSIPTAALVTAAELHIWTDTDSGNAVSLYPLLEGFNEATATWIERTTGTSWTTAGAGPPSRGTTAIGTVNPTQQSTEYVIPITTATVAGWVATPATNLGIAFFTTDADGTRFSTREHPTTGNRPYLRVTHAP